MRILVACLPILLLGSVAEAAPRTSPRNLPQISTGPGVLTSTGTGIRTKTSAAPDTFCLYGGPGSIEGKFATGFPEVVPDEQGWTGIDETEGEIFWQRSTFYAENLNGNGPGNHAMWCGLEETQTVGWAEAPGYGNSWNAILEFRQPVADPSVGQTVDMEFFFNLESEPGYDFLRVDYNLDGTWIETYAGTGYNGGLEGPEVPGERYTDVETATITYAGNDYPDGEIQIRIRGTSDGAWSDQDGLWPTDGGLAQVDDILVQHLDGVSFEDFEGSGPYVWVPQLGPYAGYFGRAFQKVGDLDPCADNITPVYGFMDDGQGPYNAIYTGTGTGGTTSLTWSYGLDGGWVTNYNGGVSGGIETVSNVAVSPEIDWDLPGTEDDGPNVVGAELRFSLFMHLPLNNGNFFQWRVRGRQSGDQWGGWNDRNFVYYSSWTENGVWENWRRDVSDFLIDYFNNTADHIQIGMASLDLANVFAFPGTDATISPVFDNVTLVKYEVPGPMFATRDIDLFQDSFAQSGETDFSTEASRDNADVALDMARDISWGQLNIPGDSIIVDITALIPGTTVDPADVELHYALHTNPLFEDAIRGNLTGSASETVGAGLHGWDLWSGVVPGQQSYATGGTSPVPGRYFFSPPDVDFLYPGDVFEWFLRVEDSSGNVSTFPRHLTGFGDATPHDYDRTFSVQALPTATANGQPEILVLDYGGHGDHGETRRNAMDQMGLVEGVHYDTYVVKGPGSFISNGIGTSGQHGATPAQLAGYSCVLLDGDEMSALFRDGTDTGNSDKGDDYGVVTAWFNQPADRLIAAFGDQIGYGMSDNGWGSIAGDVFLGTILGVEFLQKDLAPLIGGRINPTVTPTGAVASYTTSFLAGNACYRGSTRSIPRELNAIAAVPGGPVRSHVFDGSSGNEAAGVVWDRTVDGYRKISATFPMGLDTVWSPHAKLDPGASARANLLEETLGMLGTAHGPPGTPTDGGDVPQRFAVGQAYPNPFNPKTHLRLSAPRAGQIAVHVYNVRGERVATLLDGEIAAGESVLEWDGRDSRGASVASGIYMLTVEGFGEREQQKLVLLK